jgi:hypothetical protein
MKNNTHTHTHTHTYIHTNYLMCDNKKGGKWERASQRERNRETRGS